MKQRNALLEHGVDAGYAAYCDHTVLRAYTPSSVVREFCEEAIKEAEALIPAHSSQSRVFIPAEPVE